MLHKKVSPSPRGLAGWRGFLRHLPIALLFAAVPFLSASSSSPITGSYTILQHTARGSQTKIQIRIRLVNHGSSDLSIHRIVPWDLSHPQRVASHACALTVRAHSSLETTQEFIIRRPEYQLWQRGLRPRFLLELSPGGAGRRTIVVGLDHVSPQEAK
jgi:hypothetical protein